MQILPHNEPLPGPDDWFTGQVMVRSMKPITENSSLSISEVHFPAGARSAWHSHPNGQTLIVTEGRGVIQKRGESIQIIKPGDTIWTEPGEEHWHGASIDQSMTHLAIQDSDESGNFASWGAKISDEEYNQQLQT